MTPTTTLLARALLSGDEAAIQIAVELLVLEAFNEVFGKDS
jgi:hypothetical protein